MTAELPRLAEFGDEPSPELRDLLRMIALGVPASPAALILIADAVAGSADRGVTRLLPILRDIPGFGTLPLPLQTGILAAHRRVNARFVVLDHMARRVVADFCAADLPALFLKGFPLALTAYARPAHRPMGDLDLAVPAADFARATVRLEALGFKEKPVGVGAVPGITTHALSFHHAESSVAVDLHYHILGCSLWPGADDGFWAEAVPLDAAKMEGALTLAPEHHVVQACLHGYARSVLQLSVRWILDVHTVLTRQGACFRWELVEAEAARHRCGPILAAALGYVAEALQTPVPPGVISRLARAPARPYDLDYFRETAALSHRTSFVHRARRFWLASQRQSDRTIRSPQALLNAMEEQWGCSSIGGLLRQLWRRRVEPAWLRDKRAAVSAKVG